MGSLLGPPEKSHLVCEAVGPVGNREAQGIICDEVSLEPLMDLPIGWPMPQNHHFIYYPYDEAFDGICSHRSFIQQTLGFILKIPWMFCRTCQNASLGIPMSNDQLLSYYSIHYQRSAPPSARRKRTKEVHAAFVHRLLTKGSRVLEVGAAEGYASRYLVRKGHDVYGLEPSSFQQQLRGEGGITIASELKSLKQLQFDCVFLHHVFEHIVHPKEFLQRCRALLKDKGMLIIQVPDVSQQVGHYLRSLRWCHYARLNRPRINRGLIRREFSRDSSYKWMDAFSNDHVSAYTPKGITELLRSEGFTVSVLQQTTPDRLIFNQHEFSWPIDYENGQTPNGLTVVALR